jgi:hypothetical protein
MIPFQYVSVKISNNGKYYRKLGYGHCKQGDVILVVSNDLPKQCNKKVIAICDDCELKFERQYQLLLRQEIHRCHKCHRLYVAKISGVSERISALNSTRIGVLHPRYNPNSSKFQAYRTKVNWLSEKTYRKFKEIINPWDYPRTLCGIEGGWQLDHKVSVKEGFESGITVEKLSKMENLQMLPWQDNLAKRSQRI